MGRHVDPRLAALCLALLSHSAGCVSLPFFKPPSNGGSGASPTAASGAPKGRVDIGELSPAEREVSPEEQQRSVLFAKARLLEADGQPAQAVALYEQLLKSDPQHRDARHRLAVVCAEQGELERADDCFQRLLDEGQASAELHADYGYFCYLVGRPDEAESHLLQAIKLNPALSEAHNNLGLLSASQGQTERALACCVHAGCTLPEARENVRLVQQLELDRAALPEQRSTGSAGCDVGRARIAE